MVEKTYVQQTIQQFYYNRILRKSTFTPKKQFRILPPFSKQNDLKI